MDIRKFGRWIHVHGGDPDHPSASCAGCGPGRGTRPPEQKLCKKKREYIALEKYDKKRAEEHENKSHPGNVDPAHGASIAGASMSVHPLLDQIILNRNKDIVENSYIDAMVVELVPTGVESLGVVVVHLLKANRAGVRVLQVLGQRNAREQNRRNDELESAQNLLVDERGWWLGGPLWGELAH